MKLPEPKKDRKVWEETLYKLALKRFGRMTNIGFYKLFLTTEDFIHDNYLKFISKDEYFENCETFEHYYHIFVRYMVMWQKVSFSNRSSKGREFLDRRYEIMTEVNWDILAEQTKVNPTFSDDKIVRLADNYDILKLYVRGYSYKDISEMKGTYPVDIRRRALKEIDHLKSTQVFKELTNDRKDRHKILDVVK